MPLTSTAAWPALTDGKKAKASEVEEKFDWLEGSQYPMLGGNLTTSVYDLGSVAYPWRAIYADALNVGGFTVTSKIAGYGIKAFGLVRNNSITAGYNISTISNPSTGTYNVVWTSAFASNNYAVVASPGPLGIPISAPAYAILTISTMTAGGVTIYAWNFSGAAQALASFNVLATGDQP